MRRLHFVRRLVLLSLMLIFGWLAIHPVVKNSIVDAVRSTTGAATSIGDVRTSWRSQTVRLTDLQIADPHQDGGSLFQADQVVLELDRDGLLNRRAVVTRGSVDGLRVGGTLNHIEALDNDRIESYKKGVSERFQRVSGHWLSKASERVKAGWPSEIKSANMAAEFAERWPQANRTIESNASDLLEQTIAIREKLEASGQNRLRNLAAYQTAVTDIERLSLEIDQFERHISQLQQQMRMDREALDAASRQDSDSLAQQAGLASLDPEALSDYLVGAEVSDNLARVLHWVAWSRRFTPAFSTASSTNRRGRDITFGHPLRRSDVLIESLVLQGSMDLGAGEVPLDGTIRNWSSNASCADPTEIVVQTGGATPMLVQAVLDRRGNECKDRIVVDCPRLRQEVRLLGSADELRVRVTPGEMHMWCHIDIAGDRMTGRLLMKQANASFRPYSNVAEQPEITRALETTMRGLDTLDIAVNIGGTITTPEWSLTSNLGPHIAEGLQHSLETEMIAHNRQTVEQAQAEAIAQLQVTESEVIERQNATMTKLRESLRAIHQVRNRIATRTRLTDGVIDPKSPLRETYHR